jgi:hypothetical protein
MTAKIPHYTLKEFIKDCSKIGKVYVPTKVEKEARRDFNLNNQGEILKFIAAGGLNPATHQNTSTIDDWPQNDICETFDAYEFKIGNKRGYLAFYKSPRDKRWVVKSFHQPKFGEHSKDLTHSPFSQLEEKLK